jgi:CRP-like cAMP-binding protein
MKSQTWFGCSIFFDILSQYAILTHCDRETLHLTQHNPKRVRRGELIKSDTCHQDSLLAIQDGWAYSSRLTSEGDRKIIDLYLPGDIIGLRDYYQGGNCDQVIMLTEGLIIPAAKSKIDAAMENSSTLARALLAIAMYQSHLMADRLNNLINHDATTRIAYFILELHARLNNTNSGINEVFLPISQQVIGDLLGITNVHVCRCLNHLEYLGLLHRNKENRNLVILNYEELARVARFNTAYAHHSLRASENEAH